MMNLKKFAHIDLTITKHRVICMNENLLRFSTKFLQMLRILVSGIHVQSQENVIEMSIVWSHRYQIYGQIL